MENNLFIDAIILFLGFIVFTALHEYAHAWMAVRCGDDTPREQGRLTLDPLAHVEWIGTVILPLVLLLTSAASGHVWLMGWGRPVQVNLDNFRYRRRDDILVSAAGPAMNFVIAVVLLLAAKAAQLGGYHDGMEVALHLARFSLLLCFFNLLPIPPLDGGHIMRNMIGMSDEAYAAMSRYSVRFFLIIMRVPQIGQFVDAYTTCVLAVLAWPLGWNLPT
jgi:Zn-dependent protease